MVQAEGWGLEIQGGRDGALLPIRGGDWEERWTARLQLPLNYQGRPR